MDSQYLNGKGQEPALSVADKDFITILDTVSIGETREYLRSNPLWDIRRQNNIRKIIYVYIVNERNELIGTLDVTSFATACDDPKVGDVAITLVHSVTEKATISDAIDQMATCGVKALPILSAQKTILGVIGFEHLGGELDLGQMQADELQIKTAELEQQADVLESELDTLSGFKQDRMKNASIFTAFKLRCPWLLVTLAAGNICALLLEANDSLNSKLPLLLRFLPLLLGLAEAICHQTTSISIGEDLGGKSSRKKIFHLLNREVGVCFLLGAILSAIVGGFISIIFGDWKAGLCLGITMLLATIAAGIIGLLIPACIRSCKGNTNSSAGPLALGTTDLAAIIILITVAAFFV